MLCLLGLCWVKYCTVTVGLTIMFVKVVLGQVLHCFCRFIVVFVKVVLGQVLHYL